MMNRRHALKTLLAMVSPSSAVGRGAVRVHAPGHRRRRATRASRSTTPMASSSALSGALYFCDLDNQRIRRLDLSTAHATVAGNGQKAMRETAARHRSLAQHAARDPVRRRRASLHRRTRQPRDPQGGRTDGVISTFAGTGTPASPATADRRHRRSCASRTASRWMRPPRLLICDIGNHRMRRVASRHAARSRRSAAPGDRQPTPDGAPLEGTPLNGPRTMAFDRRATCTSRCAKATPSTAWTAGRRRLHHVAGTGEQGYAGDGGPARPATLAGPGAGVAAQRLRGRHRKSRRSAHRPGRRASCERCSAPVSGVTGRSRIRASAPCRPHGVFVDAGGVLYVSDSEAHRIRVLE